MNRNQQQTLYDMLFGIVKARDLTQYMTRGEFVADERTIFAVTHALFLMSRAAIRAGNSRQIYKRYPSIPWKTIRGVSRRLAQFYQVVDPKVLWQTVKIDLPPLEEELRKILDVNKLGTEENKVVRIVFSQTATLTPNYLDFVISPFIGAISEMQEVINSAKGRTDQKK